MRVRFELARAAWFIPAFLINMLFLGTTQTLSHFPVQYWALYQHTITGLSDLFRVDPQTFYDAASLVLTISIVVLVYIGFRAQGVKKAVLRALQICSITFVPLGFEVLTFDFAEWNLHVTEFQATYNILPWFTNSDLLFLAIALAIFSTSTLRLSNSRRKPTACRQN